MWSTDYSDLKVLGKPQNVSVSRGIHRVPDCWGFNRDPSVLFFISGITRQQGLGMAKQARDHEDGALKLKIVGVGDGNVYLVKVVALTSSIDSDDEDSEF